MMGEEHGKFLKVMGVRARAIQQILEMWMKGNVKAIIQSFARYHFIYLVLTSMSHPMY